MGLADGALEFGLRGRSGSTRWVHHGTHTRGTWNEETGLDVGGGRGGRTGSVVGARGGRGAGASGEDWDVEVVAFVESDEGITKSGGSVGVTIALGAIELSAELGRASGSGSWREVLVLG